MSDSDENTVETTPKKKVEHDLWHSFEHVTDRKTQIIENLLKDLGESEEQYAKILQSHTVTIDALLALHKERLSDLHSAYENDRRSLLWQTAKTNTNIKSSAATDEEYIYTLLYGLEKSMEEFNARGEAKHMVKKDDFRNDMLCDCEELQSEKESSVKKLWKKFQVVLKDYGVATESKRSHYNRLKYRDLESSAAVMHYSDRVNQLTEQINHLKQQLTAFISDQDTHVQDLKEEREHFVRYFWIMRNRLANGRTLDQRQLTHMTVTSNAAIKDLELLISKGGRIIQLYLMCCKMETEQEKVTPFGYEALNADERFGVELELKQDSDELLSQEVINYSKMDNFWKRYNCVYLERAALRLHQEALALENQQLQGAVRHYLATISQGNGLQDVQVPLTGARPSTTRTVRKHITLITGEEEKIRKPRPVTCIEASTSIAVQHMLRSKIM